MKLMRFLRKSLSLSFFLLIFGEYNTVLGQVSADDIPVLNIERDKFLLQVQSQIADGEVSQPIVEEFSSQLKKIKQVIDKTRSASRLEKEKARRSIGYLLGEINKNLAKKNIHFYDINTALNDYETVLKAVLQHKAILPLMSRINSRNSEMIANAFNQFREAALLQDIATYKRVSSTPEFIFYFLESKPDFRFADSLLLEAAIHDPMKVVYYLRRNESTLKKRIQNAQSSYVRQIASLSGQKNAADLTAFTAHLMEGKMSNEEIVNTRSEPSKYFQLLINTLLISNSKQGNISLSLRKGVKEKALAFYVNEINDLHNSADHVRFASVNGLRTEDLYFIITTCGDELYTSSYLGLYKRLMIQLNERTVDSLFDMVRWKDYHIFLRLAANYNVLDDFLKKLSVEKCKQVLGLYIGSVDMEGGNAIDKAMDIADSFAGLDNSPEILDIIRQELQENLNRCKINRNLQCSRLYQILNYVFEKTRQPDGPEKLWQVLGNYEKLQYDALKDAEGKITEVLLFYGDEDGVASFNNFLRTYTDKSKWQVTRNENWVKITPQFGHILSIYANLPLDMENKLDLAAQDKMFSFLKEKGSSPSILVHRGHSYHLDKTLKRLTPSVKLSIFGSCGSYNKAISLASFNPDIQVIGSKQTGSKSINDPILDLINDSIIEGKDLYWPHLWERLRDRFKKDSNILTVFNEYFPPNHNLSLFVLKIYQSNKRLL